MNDTTNVRAAVLISLAGILALISSCSLSVESGSDPAPQDETTFVRDGYPFSSRYPASFAVENQINNLGPTGSGNQPTDQVALAAGTQDLILIQRYPLRHVFTDADLPAAKTEVEALVGRLTGRPPQNGTISTIGGFPALRYIPIEVSAAKGLHARVTFLFSGDQEFEIDLPVQQRGRRRRPRRVRPVTGHTRASVSPDATSPTAAAVHMSPSTARACTGRPASGARSARRASTAAARSAGGSSHRRPGPASSDAECSHSRARTCRGRHR